VKKSVTSDEDNVNDNSSVQHGIWAKSGTELSHFPFTGKPGINTDLKDLRNPLEFFENMPNLKQRSRTRHLKMKRNEILKLLAFFLLQGLHQKPNNKSYFSQRKILETPIFLTCQ
jgi:hypothetical protein